MAIPNVSTLASYPTARFGAIGQSLAAFLYYSYAGYGFKTKFAEIMRGSGNDAIVDGGIEIAPYATGGSFASQNNKDAAEAYDSEAYTSSAVHWIDNSATYGSVASSARTRMLARNASNKVTHLMGDQGQADAVIAAGLGAFVSPSVGPAEGADNWENAWTNLIPGYREYLESSVTGQIAWAMLGRSLSLTDTLGYERIRQKQLQLLADNPGAIFKGLETWDLELGDSVHPSNVGQTIYGQRLAEMIARELYGVVEYEDAAEQADPGFGTTVKIFEGPSIASVSLAADNVTVTVTVASETVTGTEDTIYMPPRAGPVPCGFAFWDASEDMDQIFNTTDPPPVQRPSGDWSWNPATLEITFTLATPITGTIAMAFPFDNVSDYNPDAVIKGSVSDKPLQSWMR